jgi:glucokinase
MTRLVVVDIGGTHARFAIASLNQGRVSIANEVVSKTVDHASFETAWDWFAAQIDDFLPRKAAIAVACPVGGEVLKMTNNTWIIRPAGLRDRLRLDRLILVNDFEAIGHAVDQFRRGDFVHLCGPDGSLPEEGVISVVGPGTGLGVAQLLRRHGACWVLDTEGGHQDFAPLDGIEDRVLQWMRQSYCRVSTERLISGPGLANWYQGLNRIEGRAATIQDDASLWAAALAGNDAMAVAALERLCLSLGSFAGDVALMHGAKALVIAGGVGQRLGEYLPRSGFAQRFVAKGRLECHLTGIPVKLVAHPQPGLIGAAAAFARSEQGIKPEHPSCEAEQSTLYRS